MVFDSIPVMTAFDVLIVGIVSAALYWLFCYRRRIAAFGGGTGLVAVSFGLFVVGIFYLIDLAVMHAAPLVIGPVRAMTMMEDLHLNARWVVTLFSVGSIAFGILSVSRRFFGLSGELDSATTRVREYQATEKQLADSLQSKTAILDNAQRC